MRLSNVLKKLKEAEEGKLKKGYAWDAATYAFYRYTLMLLTEIAESIKGKKRKKRKPTAWNLFAAKYLREGKTIQDAARDWKGKSIQDAVRDWKKQQGN